jgi:hypothetical protein
MAPHSLSDEALAAQTETLNLGSEASKSETTKIEVSEVEATKSESESGVSGVQVAPVAVEEAVQGTEKIETRTKYVSKPLRTIFPELVLEEHPIDKIPSIKVIVVGAGISGINAGILLPAKVPGIELVILERYPDVVSPYTTKAYQLSIEDSNPSRAASGIVMSIPA